MKCPKCNKEVYFKERQPYNGTEWHKQCFKCQSEACGKTLQGGSYTDHKGMPYCNSCYNKHFRAKGYGFGQTVDSHVYSGKGTPASAPKVDAKSGSFAGVTATRVALPASGTPAPASGDAGGGGGFCSSCGTARGAGNFCSSCGRNFN